jgi:phage shock protein PspC (stress-responsive transcriptional regulator)
MKQVININFHGRVVPIEVTAFDILKQYTDSLNRFFANEEGKEEIINDIESRIGELFQERLKAGATCITDEDVHAIIRSMGRPEDFEPAEPDAGSYEKNNQGAAEAETSFQSQSSTTGQPKRLYRDENDKVFGGVCSGLANYFGIDVVVMRIIFVILAVSFGFGLIPYLILWVAVPSTATKEIGGMRKKLYRDGDDKIIAGVCSGIGNYFGINAWIPRVMFLLPFLSFVTRWNNHWGDFGFPDFVRLSFSPGALIIYIILWLVIPEAITTSEKLEMKGEKVDMNSIKNTVMEEMKGVQQRAEKFSKEAGAMAQEKSKIIGSEIRTAARRGSRSLGDVIILIFKIFAYFILGSIVFALVMALIALGIVSIGLFPVKDFILREGWQNVFAWGTLIFFIAVPIIGIITWLIRKLARIKRNSVPMRISFIGLWVIGWVCFICLIAFVSRDFKSGNTLREEEVALNNPGVNKLEITSLRSDQKYYRNRWFRIEPFESLEEDTVLVRNVRVNIVRSKNDSFRVTMLKMANGNTRRYADTLASMIQFNVVQQDSILLLDRGIPITRKDKFRNQHIILTVYVPVGKQVRIDKSIGWWHNVRFDGPWTNENNWDIDIEDAEQGWDFGIDYIMKADGLYTLDGTPADTWKHSENKNDDNPEGFRSPDNYRYDNPSIPVVDSLKLKLELEQQRVKDSLQRVKENIDRQLNKLQARVDNKKSLQTSSLMTYSPMLVVY